MRNVPRILPLVGVAVGGVLAINALSGAQALPDLLSGAKALAADAKVDAKLKALNGLKADINGLLKQADAKEDAEVDRLVKVFEAMKPKDAAPRIVLLDDAVRLPIAAKMKERALSAVLANMPP